MDNESAKDLWESFKMHNPNLPDHYAVWSFGDSPEMANELGELVLGGLKTATSSLLKCYEAENQPIPQPGEYSIILDGNGQAIGIIQTMNVSIYSFEEVPEEIAYEEGEGDRTIAYWREVHKDFFKRQCDTIGESFSTKMEVVCERFELVFAA